MNKTVDTLSLTIVLVIFIINNHTLANNQFLFFLNALSLYYLSDLNYIFINIYFTY